MRSGRVYESNDHTRWGEVNRGSAASLPINNESVALVVTSPPYNVGVDYDEYVDDISWDAYSEMAHKAADQMHRILIPGGRAWVNVMPSIPKKRLVGEDPDASRVNLLNIWTDALAISGLQYRDTITWVQDSHDGGCAWGSWLRPTAPNLRGGWEAILVFFKGEWKRTAPEGQETYVAERHELGGDWADLSRNVWNLRPERRRPDAPAPYPIDLPARAIRLSTWPKEKVVDPFAGSGTTVKAAELLGRQGIGFDIGAKVRA